MSKDVDIRKAAEALVFTVSLSANVAAADIRQAAFDIAKKYGETQSRQIEDEIRRHIRQKP